MSKLCQTFQSLYKPSQASMLFHTIYLPLSEWVLWSFWLWSNLWKHLLFLNLLVQIIFFDKNHWFQLLSTKNDWIISLFLISITLYRISLHSIISSFCWQKNNLDFRWKFYCCSLTQSPKARKFCFSVCSLSFFRFFRFRFLAYWGRYCKFARFHSLTIGNCTNQVTLSNKHMKSLSGVRQLGSL